MFSCASDCTPLLWLQTSKWPGCPNPGLAKGKSETWLQCRSKETGHRDTSHVTFGTTNAVTSMLLPARLTGDIWKLSVDLIGALWDSPPIPVCQRPHHILLHILNPQLTVWQRIVVSDIAKVFDVLGWFSLVTIKMKILLQRLWLGRFSSQIYSQKLVTVEKWASFLGNHAQLLTCWSYHCINASAWFQWCFWGRLCRSSLPAHGGYDWKRPHFTCSLKIESVSYKAAVYTQIGTLWSSSTH